MKRRILIIVVALLIFSFLNAEKFGYINSKAIFQRYKGIEDINREIDKELTEWNKQMGEMQNELSELELTYKEQEAMLSEDAKMRKQQEISSKRDALNKFIEEIFGESGKSTTINKQMLKPVADKISSIIKKIGDEEGYTIIVDFADGNILYARKDADLTDRVLEELNKEFFIPVAAIKRYIVFDFVPEDKETRNEQYHIKMAKTLYTSLKIENKVEPVNIKDVNDYLKKAGITNIEDMKPMDAINYGVALNADYSVAGKIKMSGGKIIINVKLYSMKMRNEVLNIEKEALSAIDFNAVASEILTEIKTYIEK
ncbi:MAG: OmpH family outer membrane protein [bacterium]